MRWGGNLTANKQVEGEKRNKKLPYLYCPDN